MQHAAKVRSCTQHGVRCSSTHLPTKGLLNGTPNIHQIPRLSFQIFKNFLGRGSPSPLPRPLSSLFLWLRPWIGLRPQFSGASRPRFGLHPQFWTPLSKILDSPVFIVNVIATTLEFLDQPCIEWRAELAARKCGCGVRGTTRWSSALDNRLHSAVAMGSTVAGQATRGGSCFRARNFDPTPDNHHQSSSS